ncbi:hypothetical protein JCM8097_009053 [Rhodosporidiobolus ruineniae]
MPAIPFLGKNKRAGATDADHDANAVDRDRAAHAAKGGALNARDELVAMITEFVGTTMLLFFISGGVNTAKLLTTSVTGSPQVFDGEGNNPGGAYNTDSLMYISLVTAFTYSIILWMFYKVTVGLFNPAISIGLAVAGWLKPARLLYLIPIQMLGSMSGAALYDALTPGSLHALTRVNGDIEYSRATFLEAFGTMLLMLSVLFLATERRRSSFIAPIGIGMAYWIALLNITFWTGGSLNPVRSFGPAVARADFAGYHWLYWVGPIIGALFASTFYRFIKLIGYDHFAHPDEGYSRPAHYGHGHNHGALGAGTGTGAGVGTTGATQGHNHGTTQGSFFARTAARDQSSLTSGFGAPDGHGAARDDPCSSIGNYHNRAGIGAGPEHTGLSHKWGDGAVHGNERNRVSGALGAGHGGRDEEKAVGGYTTNATHADATLLSRLDRIESLLLNGNTSHLASVQPAAGYTRSTHAAGRPSHDGTLYEEPAGGHAEGHAWKGTKTVV